MRVAVSPHYPLEMALEVCKATGVVEGQVYVLGRLGNHKEALKIMLEEMRDVKGAVEFVRTCRGSVELWLELLARVVQTPEMVESLLQYVSASPLGFGLDTVELVRQLPDSMGHGVGKLRHSLVGLLRQAANERELTNDAVAAGQADCMALLRERHRLLQLGLPQLRPQPEAERAHPLDK